MNNNINLNLYKIFYEVAKYNSISAASKKMYLSQPAVSKAIKKLEDEIGTILFYRTLNGIVLTEKGQELYKYLEEAFNNIRLAEKKMAEDKNLEKGSVTIGVRSHIASFYLMDKIIAFHEKYPKIDINIISRPSIELLKMLSNNKLDFILDISSYKDDVSSYDVKEIKKLSHCFVTLNNTKFLPNKKKYDLKELKDKPLILPPSHSSHRQILNSLAKDNNMEFSNVLSIETSELIYDMVKKGLGIGYILYDMVKEDLDKGILKEIKIEESLPEVYLDLICKEKRLTEAPHRFIEEFID